MRIFLTGATGYIGSAVMDALLRSGHEVTALVRDFLEFKFFSAVVACPCLDRV